MNIITRQEAIVKGLKYYFTGKPCPQGHITKRVVKNCVCYECKTTDRTRYEKENPLKLKERQANYYKNNKNYYKTKNNKYRIKNKKYFNAQGAKYRAKKLQRTPSWADLEAITLFYKNCPEGMAVDHIIPLQGKNVSGFHILENLQYLTKEENSKKSNYFEPNILV